MLSLIFLLSACAPLYLGFQSKTGKSQQQFMQDRYECYKETQQRISNAYVNEYGGSSSSQVLPKCSAFYACLAARGFYQYNTEDMQQLYKPGYYYVPQGASVQCTQ